MNLMMGLAVDTLGINCEINAWSPNSRNDRCLFILARIKNTVNTGMTSRK
jgi:hypothetical protein